MQKGPRIYCPIFNIFVPLDSVGPVRDWQDHLCTEMSRGSGGQERSFWVEVKKRVFSQGSSNNTKRLELLGVKWQPESHGDSLDLVASCP